MTCVRWCGRRFQRLGRQVSQLATLEVVLSEERNPAIADSQVAEATFYLKGVTLHAREASPEMTHTVHELAEDVRRQVKKHRELRRKRRQTRQTGRAGCAGRPAELPTAVGFEAEGSIRGAGRRSRRRHGTAPGRSAGPARRRSASRRW